MSHACSCSHHGTPIAAPARPEAGLDPRRTVAEVSQASPRALEAMKALGINHCCGAHLTLAEAAASAGVELPVLLAAVREALAAEPAKTA
jgi:iron-sulfur cluster repair protein YtfE (RIC family)